MNKAAYEISLLGFEVLPETDRENYFDPKTLRISQKGRNVFAMSGDFEVKHNFGSHDSVSISYRFVFVLTEMHYNEIV